MSSKPLLALCAAASLLAANGFSNVRNVPGSWKAWTAAGYPQETPAG